MNYKTLDDVRFNDATVHRMMQMEASLSDIIVQLANEKADLLSELATRYPPHIVMLPPPALQKPGLPTLPHTPIIHTPHIPPNTPQ